MKENCKNILVIDDDPAVCQSLKDVLEINGYSVTIAKDGVDGITALNEMPESPCLILLDLMMPGMNGWGFLDYQRGDTRFASVPVVICSAYENSARSVSKNAILTKPVKLSSLLGAVKAFCA